MKLVFVVILSVCVELACFAEARYVQRNSASIEEKPQRFILLKDENNGLYLLDTQRSLLDVEVDDKEVTFHYTSRRTDSIKFDVDDIQDIAQLTDFDPKRRTMFIIHGLNNDKNSRINTIISKALLDTDDWNVFVVDWSAKAKMIYPTALSAVPKVGVIVANFIKKVEEYAGLEMEKLHLCGHSLGAHVAGKVGEQLQGKVKNIVGMDPAFPAVSYDNLSLRIDPSDAQYVQIIHTNGGMLGYRKPLGHVDFYPNGGMNQKGCGLDLFGTCAHSRSYKYFAESIIENNFRAKQCNSYDDFKDGLCDENEEGFMGGNHLNEKLEGDFYLTTSGSEPFALG